MPIKRIPITAAKEISNKFQQDQVIIVTWDRQTNTQHVVTYGKTKLDCKQAAMGGDFVKKALGWGKNETDKVYKDSEE